MTIFEVGALGEFLGSLGVVITLIILVLQIRQNTATINDTNLRSVTDRTIEHGRFAAQVPGLMSIFQRGSSDLSVLTDEERWIFGTYMFTMMCDFQEQYHLFQQSRLPEYYWEHMNKNQLLYLRRPGGTEWWRSGKELLGDEFVSYVDEKLQPNSYT
jgi:hypothetical protein